GRRRLARYSRNLLSGLCDTSTAGNSTDTSPADLPTLPLAHLSIHRVGSVPIERGLRPLEGPKQAIERRFPLPGRVVGPVGDLLANALDELGAYLVFITIGAWRAAPRGTDRRRFRLL